MFESTRSWASRKNLEHTHIHDQHTRALLDSQGRIHIQYPCPSRSTTLQRIPAGPTTFHQHLLHQLKRRRHSWHSKGPTTGKGIKVVLQKYPQGNCSNAASMQRIILAILGGNMQTSICPSATGSTNQRLVEWVCRSWKKPRKSSERREWQMRSPHLKLCKNISIYF